jgi:hypothetical protein
MLDFVLVLLFAIYFFSFFIGTFFSNSIPRNIINQDLVNQEFDFMIVSVFPSMGWLGPQNPGHKFERLAQVGLGLFFRSFYTIDFFQFHHSIGLSWSHIPGHAFHVLTQLDSSQFCFYAQFISCCIFLITLSN